MRHQLVDKEQLAALGSARPPQFSADWIQNRSLVRLVAATRAYLGNALPNMSGEALQKTHPIMRELVAALQEAEQK
jgi:hypothetical protein